MKERNLSMKQKKSDETSCTQSEKRRLRALEATTDGVWEWNLQTNEVITCPAHFTMLGYDASNDMASPEVITSYEELIDLIYEDDRADFERRLREYIASKKSTYEMEMRLKTKSGGYKWILKRSKVVEWDEQGNPIRMIGTNIDINESRQAEEALKQSEKRLRAQYMSMPFPIYTWQKKGDDFILSNYNTATEEFTDGHIPGFIGKKARILYRKNPEILEKIIEAYDKKTICKSETTYCMFSLKETKHIIYTCSYVVPDMVLVQLEDITKQKQAEENLRCSEESLRDLTVQLLKAEENVRKYIAQELHDNIGQHLSSIKYIAENAVSQIQDGHAEQGFQSLEKLISTTQDTIDEVSKISMDLRPSVLDELGIIATINWFCREYRLIYDKIDLVKKIEIEEKDVPFNIRIPLFRIIQESLNNVACHSKASRAQVSLQKINNRVELAISDNGIGFDIKKKLNRCQEHRIGFGLISMKERAHYIGGKFSIDSAEGKGTTVRASWPCV